MMFKIEMPVLGRGRESEASGDVTIWLIFLLGCYRLPNETTLTKWILIFSRLVYTHDRRATWKKKEKLPACHDGGSAAGPLLAARALPLRCRCAVLG
jgi:hypothetical protein